MMHLRTKVGIIGAGPAGLVLANVLTRSGIDCVVVEHRTREHVEGRARAGFLEHRIVEHLRHHGLAQRLEAEAIRHVRCEFRCGGRRFSVPYGELSGGKEHFVYPQQNLVRDLIELLISAGGEVLFSHSAMALEGIGAGRPTVLCRPDRAVRSANAPADLLQIECDLVAGCDGYHGVARKAPPSGSLQAFAKPYDFAWLTLLAEVPPATDEVVYALHDDGFAGWMPRTPGISRFYLQCPPSDVLDHWPDGRVWKELDHRLAVDGSADLRPGPVLEKGILEMRSAVTEPMQWGPLFLAGDAAHILTPAGAKGMNLAIADAITLADAMIAYFLEREEVLLDSYSATRLPDVWQAQEFSDWLLQLLHRPAGDDAFQQRLRLARLDLLDRASAFATLFAHRYVG